MTAAIIIPTLDEGNLAMHAMRIPSTSLAQAQTMQSALERRISGLPEVAFIYSKTGTAEVASDPMPPNVSDTFIVLRPRAQWPDPALPKENLVKRIEAAAAGIGSSSTRCCFQSAPSSRARRPISLCPAIAASRQP